MKTFLLSKTSTSTLLASAVVLALACFSGPAQAGPVLPAVGPHPPGEYQKVTTGDLVVYSATEAGSPAAWGNGDYYYPHTAYWIYNTSGKRLRTVQNHGMFPEEGPDDVQLTPGTYIVKAWSEKDGLVTVPVIIKVAETTSVHLENGRAGENDVFDAAKAVKSPSGQIVGWKA